MPSGDRRTGLITVLALLAFASVVVLGWMTWRLYQESQQSRTVQIDRLTETAALIAREIGSEFDRWEAMAAAQTGLAGLPAAGTMLSFSPDAVIAVRGESLAYYPAVAKSEVYTDDRFLRARAAEQAGDFDAAIAGYRDAATSTARTPRALATAALGRTLRAKGNIPEALAAYEELAQMDEARIDPGGHPAPLVAYRERQAIFLALGDSASAERERARIDLALRARMYLIDRPTFEFFEPALGAEPYSRPLLARAEAVATEFWPRWQASPAGRALAGKPDYAVATVWRSSSAGPLSTAIVAPIDVLMEQASNVASRLSTTVALEDPNGRHIWGKTRPDQGTASVTLKDTGLSARLLLWLTRN
jgi:tetratricopeptide (TPR) repeat protein